MPPPLPERLSALQTQSWTASLPLAIHLAPPDCRSYDDSEPYLVQYPRLSYLAFLLPRLHAFFKPKLIDPDIPPHEGWLEFEGVPLKWHYPLGLLYDLYSGAEPVFAEGKSKALTGDEEDERGKKARDAGLLVLPWRLTVHFTEYPGEQLIPLDADGRTMLDAFINAVKEADFIRNGTARAVMSLSMEDSDNLWRAVRNHDRILFNTVNSKLLNPPGMELRHIPLKVYLPTTSSAAAATQPVSEQTIPEEETKAGHIRVVQALIPPYLSSSRQQQTLGTALNNVLPSIFPSRRNPLLAVPVLHGVVVPMGAGLEELSRAAAYVDGFLHVGVVMLG